MTPKVVIAKMTIQQKPLLEAQKKDVFFLLSKYLTYHFLYCNLYTTCHTPRAQEIIFSLLPYADYTLFNSSQKAIS